MTLHDQANAVLILTLGLYVGVGIWLLVLRWPIRAGLAMASIALLPLIWQALFTDSEAHGAGLVPVFLLLPAVLLILGRLIFIAVRSLSKGWRTTIKS